jgi:LCP family protein required for cell wall assembly
MTTEGKPYRLYKGGRAKGRVPLQRTTAQEPGSGNGGAGGTPGAEPARKRRNVRRWVAVGVATVGVVLVVLVGLSVRSVSKGVAEANDRVPAGVRKQLASTDGLVAGSPRTILVLGTDGGTSRPGASRSDSIMLVRTDPGKKRISYLSIPRDLQVSIPDYGVAKINAASQVGGPALALRTVKDLTGLAVDHVVIVDFDRFEEVIDALGGIEVDVPAPIRSKKFDCPYATQERCDAWPGWRFAAGKQTMDGRRALVYSRIRVNELDPAETDFDRTRRQQQVVQATLDKATSPGAAIRLPLIGDDLVRPLATDLSTWELLQLGWVSFRADDGAAVHCRLGGDPGTVGGESVILPSEDNVEAVAMFLGRSAPQPPPQGLPYAPGCRVGAAAG